MIMIKNLRNEKPQHPWDVKVDRSSPLGNMFVMRHEEERDEVCEQYEQWFRTLAYEIPAVCEELARIRAILNEHGKLNLFCWCSPKRCHAETIKRYLEIK